MDPVQSRPVVLLAALLLAAMGCVREGDPSGSGAASTTSTRAPGPSATTLPPTTTTTVTLPDPVPVQWSDCGGGLECGRVAVPVSYQDPTGPTIELSHAMAEVGDRYQAAIFGPVANDDSLGTIHCGSEAHVCFTKDSYQVSRWAPSARSSTR